MRDRHSIRGRHAQHVQQFSMQERLTNCLLDLVLGGSCLSALTSHQISLDCSTCVAGYTDAQASCSTSIAVPNPQGHSASPPEVTWVGQVTSLLAALSWVNPKGVRPRGLGQACSKHVSSFPS
jgi:hypothetical protein